VTSAPRFDRVLAGSVLAVLAVLFLLGDDRHVGLVADGRQVIRTAVALAETGEIGQARGRDFTVDRANGDAVSRFGLAMSLLQLPAAWIAPVIEARRGPGSSQSRFLIVPWLAVGVAAGAAGAMTRRLGAGSFQVAATVALASIASPLGSYAWLEFSEPVQAAALTTALTLSLIAAQSSDRRAGLELAAGFAAGFAVLAKSSLIIVAPLMLLPLVGTRRGAVSRAAAGAAVPIAIWVAGELVRFGRLFGGYPDDRFTHPWWDGLWRLLVGPNRGLLLFWPALLLFGWAGRRWWNARLATPESRAWVAAGLALAAHVAVAAGYWGWHGMEGWGPRLILAAVPLLAPFAATAPLPGRKFVLPCVVALSVLANAPPLVQHPTPVATYIVNLTWPEVPDDEAGRYPFYATSHGVSGRTTVVPFAVLEREPAANPWQLYLWFWRASYTTGDELATRLLQPPWRRVQPSLVPPAKWPPDVARQVVPPPRLGFLGRSLTSTGGPYAMVYLDALLDQVVRANQQGQISRALDLSARRLHLQADGEAAAWRLESFRRARLATDAEALLGSLPQDVRLHPLINVVLALFDRDAGEEARARALLGSVSGSFPNTKVDQALGAPLSDWPATLDALTQPPRRDAMVVSSPN
jgi:hypothetical protein